MSDIIRKGSWTLHYTIGDVIAGPVRVGDEVETFRREKMTILGGDPPHKVNSSGRVYLGDGCGSVSFFPSVIGARWISDVGGHAADKERDQ